jgi:hypothetical protein
MFMTQKRIKAVIVNVGQKENTRNGERHANKGTGARKMFHRPCTIRSSVILKCFKLYSYVR